MKLRMKGMGEEMVKIGKISGPMVGVMVMQYLLQLISMVMVGHRGNKLSFSAASLAFSIATISSFSVHIGMAGGLETLGGQAYGAQQYQKLGILTHTAIFSQLLVSFPLAITWLFMDNILLLLHQDPAIASEAGKFAAHLIPALFANAFSQPLTRYFQMQCLIWPLLVSTLAAFAFHIPLCWFLVYETRLSVYGAAVAFDVSSWMLVVFLALFVRFSSRCDKTRAPLNCEMFCIMFSEIGSFLWLAMLSTLMVCLEYWAFEIVVLLAGLFHDPELETSVLALCVSTATVLYTVPYGIGCGASTRISNELGAGNGERVNIILYTILSLTTIEAITSASILFATRHIFGYAFTKENQVVEYFATIAPLVCCSVVLDSFISVLTGVSRGCGLQKFVTIINIVAYYVIGIPTSALLGFKLKLNGKGLWGGILLGEVVQLIALSITIGCTNWKKQAIQAQDRCFEGSSRDATNSTLVLNA